MTLRPPHYFRSIAAALLLTGASLLIAAPPAIAQNPSPELIAEYMQKSGMDRQLEGMVPGTISQMMDTLVADSRIPKDALARVEAAAKKAFNSPSGKAHFRAALASGVTTADLKHAVAFSESALGKRVIAIEVNAAARDPAEVQRRLIDVGMAMEQKQPARYTVMERLETATQASRFLVVIIEKNAVAAINAAAVVTGRPADFDTNAVKDEFKRNADKMSASIRPSLVATFAEMYEPLAMDDMERYVKALEHESFGRLTVASFRAMNQMLSELSAAMATALAQKSS